VKDVVEKHDRVNRLVKESVKTLKINIGEKLKAIQEKISLKENMDKEKYKELEENVNEVMETYVKTLKINIGEKLKAIQEKISLKENMDKEYKELRDDIDLMNKLADENGNKIGRLSPLPELDMKDDTKWDINELNGVIEKWMEEHGEVKELMEKHGEVKNTRSLYETKQMTEIDTKWDWLVGGCDKLVKEMTEIEDIQRGWLDEICDKWRIEKKEKINAMNAHLGTLELSLRSETEYIKDDTKIHANGTKETQDKISPPEFYYMKRLYSLTPEGNNLDIFESEQCKYNTLQRYKFHKQCTLDELKDNTEMIRQLKNDGFLYNFHHDNSQIVKMGEGFKVFLRDFNYFVMISSFLVAPVMMIILDHKWAKKSDRS